MLAELTELKNHHYIKECWKDGQLNLSNRNKEMLQRIITNKKSEYHFLPPFNKSMGFVIDFTNIKSIKYDELEDYVVIASVIEPFMKNIISRFTNFYNRLGQPDFDEMRIFDEINTL